jgi:hypothetical protein
MSPIAMLLAFKNNPRAVVQKIVQTGIKTFFRQGIRYRTLRNMSGLMVIGMMI